MSRDTKIVVAVVAGSALLVGGTVVAATLWFYLSVRADLDGPLHAGDGAFQDYGEDAPFDQEYVEPLEGDLAELEKRLGPNHPEVAVLLIDIADMKTTEGEPEAVVALLERALRILEGAGEDAEMLDALDLLAEAYATAGDHAASISVQQRSVRHAEQQGFAADTGIALVRLATAHVRAGQDDRAPPLVIRARRLVTQCEARGHCLGDELLPELTRLDLARVERALARGDAGSAERLMRDISRRAARDGADPCDALVDVVFARVEGQVGRCERLARAGELEEADRVYDNVLRVLALAESAADCTDLVDPYLVSDLTLVVLRADLEGGRYPEARARIDRLSHYARAHFARGELRDMIRYDVTDLVLEIAADATNHGRPDQTHQLQQFILELYTSMGLTSSPTMCEVVLAVSDSDLAILDQQLGNHDIDAAEKLVERLGPRYDDYRVRRCAPEAYHELAITFGDHALDAADRRRHADARRLLGIAQRLCRKAEPACQRELRDVERELRRR